MRDFENCLGGSLWLEEDRLIKYRIPFPSVKKSIDGDNYYTSPFIDMIESRAAVNVARILSHNTWEPVSQNLLDLLISEEETKAGIKLHEQQKEAIRCILDNSFCLITGGPGTGKTSVLKIAVNIIEKLHFGIDIHLTAPTGKAAGRIRESFGSDVITKTVQKELHLTYKKKIPDIFNGDLLIVDETSMMGMVTADDLFRSIRNGQHLVLLGDQDQLPSVENGAVLRDLIDSEVIPYVRLTKTFRQANDSALFANIKKAAQGDPDLVSDDDEFKVIDADPTPCLAAEELAEIVQKEVSTWGKDNVCCLLPYRKAGTLCSNNLNNMLQQRLNSGDSYLDAELAEGAPVRYMIGDPVMQLVNRNECANGDVGKVVSIDDGILVVDYGENQVKYNRDELPEQLSLAYAMSINKSQGSEYKCVIVCMTNEHELMLTRNLLYTAITRAKKKCVLYTEGSAVVKAMQNIAMYTNAIGEGRTTFFAEKLQEAINNV